MYECTNFYVASDDFLTLCLGFTHSLIQKQMHMQRFVSSTYIQADFISVLQDVFTLLSQICTCPWPFPFCLIFVFNSLFSCMFWLFLVLLLFFHDGAYVLLVFKSILLSSHRLIIMSPLVP